MRILQITNKPPYPPNDGSSIAVYNMACGLLNNGVELTLLCINTKKHFKPDTEVETSFKEKSRYTSVYKNTDTSFLGALFNLFSSQSYFVSRFYFIEMEQKIQALLQEKNFDIIQLESIFLGNYIPVIKKYSQAKIVVRTHNVEHLIWERMIENTSGFLKKTYLRLQTKRLKKLELQVLNQVEAIVPITAIDAAYFQKWGIHKPCHVSPTGLQLQQYKRDEVEKIPFSIFHFGSMDWLPNEEAVLWFIHQVWDKVVQKIPNATFHIIGKGMSEKIKMLTKPGVVVVGQAAHAKNVYSRYTVMVVPLLSGSGMRIKMIEGMAYANAIVSTSVGAEGIAVTNKKNCLLADTPDAFADAVIQLLSEEPLRKQIQQEARIFVEQNFENTALIQKLYSFYQSL
ncbi:MAG: glycosyltransferase [Bacteroidetes bacterium]|nr:glycosyltransferase [Bacteroidota bacterium]